MLNILLFFIIKIKHFINGLIAMNNELCFVDEINVGEEKVTDNQLLSCLIPALNPCQTDPCINALCAEVNGDPVCTCLRGFETLTNTTCTGK